VSDYFADTSALAKRYINEVGSIWLRSLLDPSTGAETYIVRTTAVELVAAVTRRERGGSLSPADASAARSAIRLDLGSEYIISDVTDALIRHAMALAETHALRGYDAIQLAAALELSLLRDAMGLPRPLLLSADAELLAAAAAEGLTVDDPNAHP
jgi:predicted nucleic acid-binding protein